MQNKPGIGWMHVDTRYIKVCATCKYWNDGFDKHLAFSNVPNHVYYDGKAREICIKSRCSTNAGSRCPSHNDKV